MGQIMLFAGNFAPRGWAFCNGQLLSINENSALFSLLGTNYGGDGRSTFGLPDLRGRVPIHAGIGPGLSPYNIGDIGGTEGVTLRTIEMPSHTHSTIVNQPSASTVTGTIKASSTSNSNVPTNKYLGQSGNIGPNNINIYGDDSDLTMASDAVSIDLSGLPSPTVTNTNTGGNLAHPNIQPFLATYYIIAIEGLYPSRD